jgi:chromosome segregation ATPase
MEPTIREDESAFLADLEERIVKAVEVVTSLRKENASLEERLQSALDGKAEAEAALTASRSEADRLQHELESLSTERKQVRTRIEKLLSQMDLLSAG